MSPMVRVALAEAQIQAKKSVKQAVAHFAKFETYCQEQGFLMGFEAVASYLTRFMQQNKGHTASLSNVLSNLRTQSDLKNKPWLSTKEEQRLKKLLDQYRLEDVTPVNRMSPLRTETAMSAINSWNLDKVWELQRATLLLLAIQVLLRTAEVMGGLTAKDFIWKKAPGSALAQSVVIRLGPTKTCRHGAGVHVELARGTQAFEFLHRLFVARNLFKKQDEYVFCMVRDNVLYPLKKASEESFRQLIKSTVASIGLDPNLYSGHSCRAGGATDLFAAGVPYYVVKKYGRWSSDTALIYYRCEFSIASQAAAAFQA